MLKLIVYSITRKFADVDNITTSDLADRIQTNQQSSDTADKSRQGSDPADKSRQGSDTAQINQPESDQIGNTEKRDLIIIDTRNKDEYLVSRLENAKHFHFKESDQELQKFITENADSKPTDVVCYCSLGYRSSILADKINKLELSNIKAYNLEGSIFKWANENRPLQGSQAVHPFSYLWGILGLNWSKWQWTPDQEK